VVARQHRGSAVLDHIEQLLVRVVPSVPGRVVRWSGQASIGKALAPIRLTFQVRSVAGSAMFSVDNLPVHYQRRVIRVRLNRLIACVARERGRH
jgi:hypothetical protein